MDRAMVLAHLAKAKEHIELGEQHVRRQRELVSELERDGHDATNARELLAQFEHLLAMHRADRDRLLRELALAGGRGPR